MFPDDIEAAAVAMVRPRRRAALRTATAESCTGGLVCGALTAIAGSSDVLVGGVVSYANRAKMGLLDVDSALLERHGAVSQPVAAAMAEGARRALGVDLAVSITGVAGPGGGTAAKPVGLVHFATALAGAETIAAERRFGDVGREAVRLASVKVALDMLLERLADGR